MTALGDMRVDWRGLWQTGDLARFCFISAGVVFHAGCENMITTIMPAMVRDLGGVEYTGWTFSIYETGSIIAGAAAGRLASYWTIRANIIVAALIFAMGCVGTVLAPTMPWLLGARLVSGVGGGALISLSFVAIRRYFPAAIWPQLMAILSVVWGVSAFGGPLYGGLMAALLSWRWAFISSPWRPSPTPSRPRRSCATRRPPPVLSRARPFLRPPLPVSPPASLPLPPPVSKPGSHIRCSC